LSRTKPFSISQTTVVEAYKRVKAKHGAGGSDEVDFETFDKDLKNNLYKIWNRMSSGTYFPLPVKAVPIPKKSGGIRVLGIPTIGDRIAQMVVKISFEPKIEPIFLPDSYGYRPNKTALDAIEVTRRRCWQNDWVLEFDIKGLFDNIDHDILIKLVKRHTKCPMEVLYIRRWLKTSMLQTDGEMVQKEKGVPQGGVISPLLANLFLHYVFDDWMKREFERNTWCRYADDALIHCQTLKQAEFIKKKLENRLKLAGLELHPEKTRIVYCKDSNRNKEYQHIQFAFLGYTFKPRKAKGKNGRTFTSFLPAISQEAKQAIRQTVHDWHLLWMTNKSLKDLAEKYNPAIRGWLNYYGKYGKRELADVLKHINLHLCYWFRRKYKKYRSKKDESRRAMGEIANKERQLFAHWAVGIMEMVG
jgi:RNA-directed DNA polymerase